MTCHSSNMIPVSQICISMTPKPKRKQNCFTQIAKLLQTFHGKQRRRNSKNTLEEGRVKKTGKQVTSLLQGCHYRQKHFLMQDQMKTYRASGKRRRVDSHIQTWLGMKVTLPAKPGRNTCFQYHLDIDVNRIKGDHYVTR